MFIFLYHQINSIPNELDPLRLAVSPAKFDAEMNYLHRNGFTCMSLLSIVQAKARNEILPSRAFAITFDDGYQDNYDHAFPILQKYGFTATIFLVPDLVGKHTQWEGLNEKQAFPLMTWNSIREMHVKGFDFGSHTRSHAPLKKVNGEKLTWELATSRQVIEAELGISVKLFAFPYESSSPALAREVERHGYMAACGTLLLAESRYNLWRTQCLGSDTMARFRLKASPVWRQLIRLGYHTKLGNNVRTATRWIRNVIFRK